MLMVILISVQLVQLIIFLCFTFNLKEHRNENNRYLLILIDRFEIMNKKFDACLVNQLRNNQDNNKILSKLTEQIERRGISMISANEARKKVEEFIGNNLEEELQKVEESINKAIMEGQCNVTIDGTLKSKTMNLLEKLGYEIKIGGRYNERDTFIKW